jgi:hypothetical protein
MPFQEWLNSLSPTTKDTATRLVSTNKVPADDIPLAWFVVELVDDNQPERLSFTSYEALVDHVRTRSQQDGVRMFVGWGTPVYVTRGQYKFIVHPNGEKTPLFHVPAAEELELDDTGQFTDDPDERIAEITEIDLGGGQRVAQSNPAGVTEDEDDYIDGPEDFDEYDVTEGNEGNEEDYVEEEPDEDEYDEEEDEEEEDEEEDD